MREFRPGSFQVLPPIVKNLIIINVLMVLIQYVLGKYGIDLADYLGLHYWSSHYFRPWQLLTHMFMHGSYDDVNATILHIFSNMFALWMFGSILENVWGPKRFLTFYIICGLGAALCHLGVLTYDYHTIERAFDFYQNNATLDQYELFLKQHVPYPTALNEPEYPLWNLHQQWSNDPSTFNINGSKSVIYQYLHGGYNINHQYFKGIFDEATVGASGAVFGVLFAFGYLFPNTLLYLYFMIPIKAKWVVGAYALFELYAGFQNAHGDKIAHFAHIGGMIFAFILLKIWGKKVRNNFY